MKAITKFKKVLEKFWATIPMEICHAWENVENADLQIYGKNKYFKNMEIEDNVMYIDVGKHTVLIKKEDEGTVVDIFEKPEKDGFFGEPIASTWAFDNE